MFGPLEVGVADTRLGPPDFGSVKAKQLLELLLLERGRMVAKDRIAEALWAQALPQRVGATIETYVSVLRSRLAAAGADRSVIITERGGYRLAADALVVDVDRFDALLRSAPQAEQDQRRAVLEEALDLASEDLLADEPYARWTIPTREHYRERQVQALVDLSECCLELSDPAAALDTAERALALEPTRERAHRAVMLAHCELGNRDAALRAYERCIDVLADELGVTPTAETAQLHTALVQDELTPSPARRGERPATEVSAAPIGFARNGAVRIAYQVVGDGPLDLVFSPSQISNLATTWDDPTYAAFLRSLASLARLILFDKRGTGLSDPALDFPTVHERSEDLVAVLDAVGSKRAVLFGVCAGGPLCLQLAADHPDRATALILHNSMARMLTCDGYPWGWAPDFYGGFLDGFEEAWLGNGAGLVRRNPSLADNPRYRDWFSRHVRLAASPWMARRLAEMNAELDVRDVLAEIGAPCLVICRTEDAWLTPESSRYLARQIDGAQLVELPGMDHDPWIGDSDQVITIVAEFLNALRASSP